MFKRVKPLVLASIMAISTLSPLSAATAAGSNTFDQDRDLLLELMQVQIDSSDPLYTDAEFIELVNDFGQISKNIDKTAENVIAILDSAVDFAEQLQEIDDPRFADYKMSAEELQELKDMVNELKAELVNSGDSFSNLLYEELLDYQTYDYNYSDEVYFDDAYSGLTAHASASTYWAAPGQEVTLYDYSSASDFNTPMSKTWMQSVGPAVELYYEDGMFPTDRKFIMPDFSGSNVAYVEFNLMISQNGKTEVSTVYINVDTTGEFMIQELYWNLLGREADPAGLDYWTTQYQNGMSIQDIEATFRASDEYKNRF